MWGIRSLISYFLAWSTYLKLKRYTEISKHLYLSSFIGFLIPQIPSCQIQLGMQNGKLPNSAITASSQLNSYYGPENARLHFHPQSGRNGAWIPNKQDHAQWLQVDFGVETVITRVETQGRQDAAQWIKEYTLRYSTDGNYFQQYQVNGYTKVSHLLRFK